MLNPAHTHPFEKQVEAGAGYTLSLRDGNGSLAQAYTFPDHFCDYVGPNPGFCTCLLT